MKALILILLALAQSVAIAAERPEDFAYGIPVQAGTQSALYEVEIPLAVYRGVTRSDLGDVRVFNGAGESVPHALKPRDSMQAKAAAVQLPVFPLRGAAGDKTDGSRIRIERRSDGTIVSIQSLTQAGPKNRRLSAYLIDASMVKQPIQSLQLEWQSDAESFVGTIRIEGSDDLNAWRILTDRAALARLSFGGFQLNQNRIELRGARHKYLRLSWPDEQSPLESLTVVAEPAGIVAARRVWHSFQGSVVSDKMGEYGYDLGGPIPFDRLRVELPQVNSVAQLQVLARGRNTDQWRLKSSATIYRLRRGDAEVTSPEIDLSSAGERQLLLRVDQKGGGIGAGVPVIQIGWIAQKLVFAARGNGPFQLAYGNSAAKPTALAIDAVIPGYKSDAQFKVEPATLAEPVTLAGPSRLRAAVDYKKWTLWAVLILGVAALGYMAYRLARQVSQAPPQSQPTDKSD
jgi:uncharacterized protein DUF3999